MTQEDKDLLLKYLSMALPYGVKVQVYYEDIAGSGYFDDTVWSIDNDEPFHANDRWIENIKPYLRSMSSMTEEERDEIEEISHGWFWINEDGEIFPMGRFTDSGEFEDAILPTFKYFLESHFDFMGLIPKNLAIEVTKENNPYENGL